MEGTLTLECGHPHTNAGVRNYLPQNGVFAHCHNDSGTRDTVISSLLRFDPVESIILYLYPHCSSLDKPVTCLQRFDSVNDTSL